MTIKRLAMAAIAACALPVLANAATVSGTGVTNGFTVLYNNSLDFGMPDNADGVDDANLGVLDLDANNIGVTGIVAGASSGSLTFDVSGSKVASGALQLLIQFAGNTLVVDSASFGGTPIAFSSTSGGLSGSFTADLSGGNATFYLKYSGASGNETFNIGIAAVPVPAAGFLLLGGLGGLVALKRRKKA